MTYELVHPIGLTMEEIKLIMDAIECRLHLMDQENQWFLEEPSVEYNQLSELYRFFEGFTNP
jgi:hypothetical protein